MKAVHCTAFGPPETLVLADIPSPLPAPGELKVKVKACALNFFDTLIIEGKYQYRPDPPFSPGAEVAGVVEAIGEGVEGFKAGDRVIGYLGWGGCSEEVAAAADKFVVMPDGLDDAVAAGLTVTYGTGLHALKDRARLKPGETLAVLGAAGGVGQAAVEIGKIMGARVIACASSDDKLDFCKRLGADEGFNYARGDLKEGLRRLTGGKGVDVIYDAVGGDLSESALQRHRLAGAFPGGGLRGGKHTEDPPQPGIAEGLRDRRGVLGRAYRTRAGTTSRQHGAIAAMGGSRAHRAARAQGLQPRRGAASAHRHRPARSHGQGDRRAVIDGMAGGGWRQRTT